MDYNFIVTEEEGQRRIDLFLVDKIGKNNSRTFIKQLIEGKDVLLNGAPAKPHTKVNQGDKISVSLKDAAPSEIAAQDIALKIIYEDEDIIVVDKPSGMVVHPGAGNKSGTLANALLAHTRELSTLNPQRPGIVHRLDKETSGVMVAAKNNMSHLKLVKQFAGHSVRKKYIAVVSGVVEFDEGVIDLPIGRHSKDFRMKKVSFIDSKRALTKYKVLKRLKGRTVVELTPRTGRTHQLRVHLAYMGYPILGDTKYGKPDEFGRLALHALELEFTHPRSGERVKFSSELPGEFAL